MKHCILIVDDEPNVRLNYRVTLETEGFEVREASDAGAALRELAGKDFDLAILDMRMPEMDGLELLESMRERNIQTPVVIITAYGDVPHAVRAMKLGAIDFLEKPLTPEALRSTVGEILGRHAKPVPRPPSPETFDAHVQAAKRLINLRQFTQSERTDREGAGNSDGFGRGLQSRRRAFRNARGLRSGEALLWAGHPAQQELRARPAKHAAHLRTLPVRFKQRAVQPRRKLMFLSYSYSLSFLEDSL